MAVSCQFGRLSVGLRCAPKDFSLVHKTEFYVDVLSQFTSPVHYNRTFGARIQKLAI